MKTLMISEMIKTLSDNNLSYYLAAVNTQHKTASELTDKRAAPESSIFSGDVKYFHDEQILG